MAKRILRRRSYPPAPANYSGIWMGECGECGSQSPIEKGKFAPEGWQWSMDVMTGIYTIYCQECLKG